MRMFPPPAGARRVAVALACAAQLAAQPASAAERPDAAATDAWAAGARALADYRRELEALRAERGAMRHLPDIPFMLFGMGARTKFLYRDGALVDLAARKEVRRFAVKDSLIVPSEYTVLLRTDRGLVKIVEDEAAVTLVEGPRRTVLTAAPVRLPRFDDQRTPGVLRVLHHEILIDVVGGKPVPNLFVYRRPWYRDGALMAMVLARTGNLELLRGWVAGLDDPYDHNNGADEADNPGQVLYLASLFGGQKHPLVPRARRELDRLTVPGQRYLQGSTDGRPHVVYQTQWASFGLRALGLPDPFQVPAQLDSYALLFWWQRAGDASIPKTRPTFSLGDAIDYPYLTWAEDHFRGTRRAPLGNRDYPLSWEAHASKADYAAMRIVSPAYEAAKLAAPHAWHAAEMFLALHAAR
jgi:hypothetical protein